MLIDSSEIYKAAHFIAPYLHKTPLILDPVISGQVKTNVFLKLENQQISGSFKARGAFNKMLAFSRHQANPGFYVAASTGNHAAAFCLALRRLNLKGKVFLPENASTSKLEFIKALEVPYELVGRTSLQTEIHCRKIAEENGYHLVHPYNDVEIIAGQGTVAIEMLDQQPELDVVVAPVGGGGLISGLGILLKSERPKIKLVGCQPAHSPEMVESISRGKIIEEDISLPTLSDGTAGGMEPGSITFEICRELVDEWALISESEIAFEIVNMLRTNQILIEGAAALPLAYLRKNQAQYQNRNVGLVITGKRISMMKLKELMKEI
ncbi:MAG: pyridoxal-phosphate dependent enzyme [Saprospiraceae bacterium]|nr:pyridoxal-phosphate dependent enzyme [Saprospiraceae bacterium]